MTSLQKTPELRMTLLHQQVTSFRRGILGKRKSVNFCRTVCAPLESYLNTAGYKVKLVSGNVRGFAHFWLAMTDGRIIDPTADQFSAPDGSPMPKVYIGKLPPGYSSDTLDTLQLVVVTCQQCGASWTPRVPDPVRCPRCQSRRWNEPPRDDDRA